MQNRYQEIVAENMTRMGSDVSEWSAVPVSGMVEVETGENSPGARMMPMFVFPQGYSSAPSMFAGQDKCCHLCGTPIKNFYWIQNDKRKWTMPVGSECVSHFGAGENGAKVAKVSIAKSNREFVQEIENRKRQLWLAYTVETPRYEMRGGMRVEIGKMRQWDYYKPGVDVAKTLVETIRATLGDVTAKVGCHNWKTCKYDENEPVYTDRQLANWLKKNGDKARELLQRADLMLG